MGAWLSLLKLILRLHASEMPDRQGFRKVLGFTHRFGLGGDLVGAEGQ